MVLHRRFIHYATRRRILNKYNDLSTYRGNYFNHRQKITEKAFVEETHQIFVK